MDYKKLHDTDIKVSAFALGTASYGGDKIDKNLAGKFIDRYMDMGGNFIDTANCYGKWLPGGLNYSEIILGEIIKDRGCRNNFVLGTKGAHPAFGKMNIPRMSEQDIRDDLEESLKALQTDYIDVYWLHRDDPSRSAEEIMDTLNVHVRSGKIRAIGCSNWQPSRIKAALEYSKRTGIAAFCADQNHYNLAKVNDEVMAGAFQTSADDEVIDMYKSGQLTAVPYSSQAQGLFSKATEQDFYTNPKYEFLRKLYINPTTERRISAVKTISAETGFEPTQIALAYLLNQPFDVVPITSPSNTKQLESILKATEIKLTSEQMNMLL